MPFRQLSWILGGLLAGILLVTPAAGAAPVLVLSGDGSTRAAHDDLPAPRELPGLIAAAGAHERGRPLATRAATRRGPTVRGELRRMRRRGAIDAPAHVARLAAYNRARSTSRRLTGVRRAELTGVIGVIDDITARRELTSSRLGPLWTTLERNEQWWRTGSLPSSGQRVQFEGSEVLWQYVPGQGLHAHPLANFGRLNGLWQGGRRYERRMGVLMDELLALRAERAGGIAWEYYFAFGPSRAPWVSGMAQATGLQALTRAADRLGRSGEVVGIAQAGLGIFEAAPPAGVRVPSGGGAHYLLYSGDPGLRVLNGFVQALSGLESFAAATGDQRARLLYDEGRTAVAPEIAASDTGAWSLYSLGRVSAEASLSYHQLLAGFLGNLCERTGDSLYCDTRERFAGYVEQPPVLRVLTRRLRAGSPGALRLRLSKRSAVTLRVERAGRLLTSRALGTVPYGRRSIPFTPPRRRPGSYTVHWTATDVAGNSSAGSATVRVRAARPARRGGGRR